jgi:hypothetical protein
LPYFGGNGDQLQGITKYKKNLPKLSEMIKIDYIRAIRSFLPLVNWKKLEKPHQLLNYLILLFEPFLIKLTENTKLKA